MGTFGCFSGFMLCYGPFGVIWGAFQVLGGLGCFGRVCWGLGVTLFIAGDFSCVCGFAWLSRVI